MESKFVKAFIIGSSLPATIWSLCVAGIANKHRHFVADYELFAVVLPAIFGFLNGILVTLNLSQKRMAIAGSIFGIILAAVGTYGLTDFHCRLLGISPRVRYLAFVFEPLFYAFVWGIVMYNLNYAFGLTPQSL